ncbi:caspase family protein [bacterium]|nr:caspase family protein [bacterium]
MLKRALIVGIDNYFDPLPPLQGCVADAKNMFTVLSTNMDGSPNFDCKFLTAPSDTVNRVDLREQTEELFAHKADVALFYFAGHGTIRDLGGYLVTQDYDRYDAGVSMADLLTLANESPIDEVVIIVDCCHSGALGEIPQLKNEYALLREGVTVLTATRASQLAKEIEGGGIFTSLLYEALSGGAADLLGKVNVANVYAYVDQILGAWDQRPMFKSNMARLLTLRQCEPELELPILRLLATYFKEPHEEFRLDPSYEPEVEPSHPEHEKVFRHLQKLRAARLVVPIGEEHMYHAAMNKKSCKLTQLGQFYWRLAKDRKF